VHEPLAALVERVTPFGWSNSLGQKLVQLTMPGVPDVYQGTELWDDSLVDPDKPPSGRLRGPGARCSNRLTRRTTPPPIDESGAAKLWPSCPRALRLAAATWPDLFHPATHRLFRGRVPPPRMRWPSIAAARDHRRHSLAGRAGAGRRVGADTTLGHRRVGHRRDHRPPRVTRRAA